MPQRSILPDPFKFAAEGRSLSAIIPLADLPRLGDVLLDTSGSVQFSLVGEMGLDRRPRMRLVISGELQVRCQRCLGPMIWPLGVDVLFELVRPGQPIADDELEEDAFDAIEAMPDMDVTALVEDEIVLAVPIAPRHEKCEAPRPDGGAVKESPFASLEKLRKNDGAE
ncbi:YceD family protein [Aromatoleum evansii]|uniref:Large ribosomal RNA subunit accumulation protein YceD n=1 Tax=Aromatoleum evansii TaxID=59406 RepID=A0ABZ1ARD1_AROEV|nr:YceD family protein [Aromatoleum evansii]NMG31462.1 metal-binding protein [Aromatoleum evansii]WRL47814.1 YceD family protein [Aromatoleum evansii]